MYNILLKTLYKIYKKYDKEYKANFNAKYYRDFPAEYSPEIVSYLMYKDINDNSFSASVFNAFHPAVA